jgi:pimeloyl-ACP methyl ester carboxylesterase
MIDGEHWIKKGDVRLFLWHKRSRAGGPRGTILFVHGSSMASQPTFDLRVPGRPHSSAMDWFAERGFDDSVPTGTYVDMCSKLPLVDPARLDLPTLVMRGEHDGIAAIGDLIEFFRRLPHPDKQFAVMAGISHASFQQKNYLSVYHVLHAFFAQPEPVYRA